MTLPETFQKLVATRHSKNFREAVEIQTIPLLPPQPGEIIVKNLYAGVNAADLMMAAGQYLLPTPVPCGMGAEAVGEIVALGEGVTAYELGSYVLMNAIGCGYTEYHTMKATQAVPIPQASAEIMSLSIGGLTASIGLELTGEMQHGGEVVLVTAAAGGTGQFAVQVAKLAGNHVIGTCGSDDKVDLLKALGCDRVVNYKKENLRDVLKAEYPRGVNIVFDGVGGTMFDAAVDNLARYGRLVTIGFISEYKDKPEIVQDVRIYYKVLGKMASIRGFNLNLFFGKPILAEHMMKLIGLLNTGKLQPQIDPQAFHGVSGAIDAVEYLQAGKNTGKVIVRF